MLERNQDVLSRAGFIEQDADNCSFYITIFVHLVCTMSVRSQRLGPYGVESGFVHCIHASGNLEKFCANYLKHKATEVPLVLMFSLVHRSECDEFRHDLC
jgi:hypothetical protein